MIDPCQYIILNKGLGMTTGKAAAQAAHAAVKGVAEHRRVLPESNIERLWYRAEHEKTIVLEARDETHMYNAFNYITGRGIEAAMVFDEGMTEVPKLSFTAIGTIIVDKSHPLTQEVFRPFSLYREDERQSLWRRLTSR